MRGPVVVTVERVVAVPSPTLWARQAAVEQWTTWHPDVSWVAPGAKVGPGCDFEWVWRGTRARSEITAFRVGSQLAWSTDTASGPSTMRWTFVADGDKTIVTVRCTLTAGHVLARRPAAARAGLERALARWIDALAAVPRYAITA
ncbi:MAG: SRPBCC family protein [Actinomycetota bacterium]|nr:SRPBCC family protein [Actinomycetota bacterium]